MTASALAPALPAPAAESFESALDLAVLAQVSRGDRIEVERLRDCTLELQLGVLEDYRAQLHQALIHAHQYLLANITSDSARVSCTNSIKFCSKPAADFKPSLRSSVPT